MNHQKLNEARIKLGWSMEKTAEVSNLPLQTTKNVLTGKSKNSRSDTIKALADALGVPIADLFIDDDTKIIEEEVIDEVVNKVIEDKKADEISVIALKEIYEHQMSAMKEVHEEHIKNIREHYERHISDLEKHYEKRLADKREHIDTILLDKKWFRLASVCSVLALLGVFFLIEFMTPGHGWFTFGR
jgi:transcriptional regulator with XRE-family HTH domain